MLIGFTVLSNIRLLKRRTFWLIAVLSVILYIPHILWQISHGYPSVNYHLYEQSTYHYDFSQTWTYFPGQLLMAGPIIGVFLFYYGFKARVKDVFIRTLMINSVFTFIFFLSSSFKGEVQPQWTLIAFAPLALLVLIQFRQAGNWRAWFQWVAIVNLLFIVTLRVMIITASPLIRMVGQVKSLYGFKQWARDIKQKAGDNYVIINDGFQNAAKYDFYNNTTRGFAYDERYYRLTQFDIWPIEEGIQHQKAYWLSKSPVKDVSTDTLNTTGGTWYGGWVNDVRTYQQVKVDVPSAKVSARPGEQLIFNLNITNVYPYAINFSNLNCTHKVTFEACLFKDGNIVQVQQSDGDFHDLTLNPLESKHYKFNFVAPPKRGTYTLMFSFRTDPFLGSKNSRIINLTIE